jgi:hypothetical protein
VGCPAVPSPGIRIDLTRCLRKPSVAGCRVWRRSNEVCRNVLRSAPPGQNLYRYSCALPRPSDRQEVPKRGASAPRSAREREVAVSTEDLKAVLEVLAGMLVQPPGYEQVRSVTATSSATSNPTGSNAPSRRPGVCGGTGLFACPAAGPADRGGGDCALALQSVRIGVGAFTTAVVAEEGVCCGA